LVSFELECDVLVTGSAGPSGDASEVDQAAMQSDEVTELPPGLVFVVADNDLIARMVGHATMTAAQADMERSLVLGETYQEASEIVERMLELAQEVRARPPPVRPRAYCPKSGMCSISATLLPHQVGERRIVGVFDQNMDYDEGSVLGSRVCHELRMKHKWKGLLFIESANDEREAVESYLAAGADGSFGKTLKGGIQSKVEVIARAYHRPLWRE
jgi:hypothetical protein